MAYVYNASKPIVQYASNKVVEGAGYLYNKINDNIKGNQKNNTNNGKQPNNIINFENRKKYHQPYNNMLTLL